jgi:fumarate hydratase subunit alpha
MIKMREINVSEITEAVKTLCIKANLRLPQDLCDCIKCNAQKEKSPVGRGVFDDILDNLSAAERETLPICQDTGMAVLFLEIGQDVHFVGGNLYDAINKGVAMGYTEGLLRKSIVSDPLERVNTGDNTPAVIHTKIVDGEQVKIMCAPKGFGSENMSQLKMMTPSVTREEIVDFVVSVCAQAGSNPCPPIVIGVGIGGDFEKCAYLAKKALCRPVSQRNPKEIYAQLESEILEKINRLGIGPQGFGGTQTCLAVNIEQAPTHIAGLPVSVNVGCHVTRHAETVI